MTAAGSWSRLRVEALESLRVLVSLMDSEASQPRLIDGYLESKRLLAEAFQAMVQERIHERVGLLDEVKAKIVAEMERSFGDAIPSKYLRVRGYVTPHRDLFAYLSLFVGKPVPSAVLRIITGDAVHTERRTRELRDLGLQLEAVKSGGSDVYVLHSLEPDEVAAARIVVRHNVNADKRLDPPERRLLLAILDQEDEPRTYSGVADFAFRELPEVQDPLEPGVGGSHELADHEDPSR